MILSTLFALSLQAQNLDSLITLAYKNDPTLAQLQEGMALSKRKSEAAALWENPNLTLGATDLRVDDLTTRSLEPMQTHFVSLSQKIPLWHKLALSKALFQGKEKIAKYRVEDAKRKILSQLTGLVYLSVIVDKKIALITKNRKNLHHIKQLLQGYQADAEYIMEVEQSLLLLRSQKEMLLAQKALYLQKIQKLTFVKPTSIEVQTKFVNIKAKVDMKHPLLAMYAQDIKIAQKATELAHAKQKPDIKVSGGYFQRAGRADYLNFSVSMPLQVQGREKIALQEAKIALKMQQHKADALHNRFDNAVKMLAIIMHKNRTTYRLYQKRILPKQKQISAYLRAKNRLNEITMIKLIDNANKVITLQNLALDELASYFKAYAKMRYYL